MSDPFLEREKELMKLNDTLNNKMTFNLKQPKSVNLKSMNKVRKFGSNKAVKSDVNQMKNRTIDTNKFKIENINNNNNNDENIITNGNNINNNGSDGSKSNSSVNNDDVKKSDSNAYSTTELDLKDAATLNRNSINDDTHKLLNPVKQFDDEISVDKMDQTLIENIEKAIDTKPSTNTAHLNLIPSNIFRKNVSSEGIIK